MRVAIVGAGISGLSCAWHLQHDHEVTLFEAGRHAGGHVNTVDVDTPTGPRAIDTGFIVFNRSDYPHFSNLLDALDVATQPTSMSFSVHDERTGREYNATDSLNRVFAQRGNLLRPDFHRMLIDIVRFYRRAPALLECSPPGPTLDEYLETEGYSGVFRDFHLLPMASALWSAPPAKVRQFPATALVAFMKRHGMLRLTGRPQWLTVRGGSRTYVKRLLERLNAQVHLETPVLGIRREEGVTLRTEHGKFSFDAVVLACHADQALALLEDSSEPERATLGAITFQPNEVTLHTDTRLLPERPRAWASWNYRIPARERGLPLVTYHMNGLQALDAPEQFCVTLNGADRIEPGRVLAKFEFAHPQFDHAAIEAQGRLPSIQGKRATWFCGAWTGLGFHEDGAASGVRVAEAMGAQ